MAVNIDALASDAAAKGQQMLQGDQNQAADYRAKYNDFSAQADAANKNVNDYTDYMKNAGSAGNQFHGEQSKELTDLGYSPEQMTAARNNLNAATGSLSAYSDFANTAASKWGMNAGGFAAANAGALGSINNNIASNQNVVNGLHDIYKTAQTGANVFTGNVIQGEHETLGGLQDVFNNAASQRDSASSMMTFFEDLASKQGGLNAQQQQYYGQAKQAYAAASAAMAQASLYGAQAAQVQQQVQQGNDYMSSPAYKAYLNGTSPSSGASPSTPTPNAGGPSLFERMGSSRVGQDLATGAINTGHAIGAGAHAVGGILSKVF